MSKFYDIADAIAARLQSVPALSGISVVVDRQRDIASELRKAIGKQSGCLILITWVSASNEDHTADGPRFASKYTVTLFSKPVIRAGETPADDVIEAVITALHDHRFSATDPYSSRLVVTGVDPVPHDELLIYRLNLTTPNQL